MKRIVEIEAAASVAVVALERLGSVEFASPEGEALRAAMTARWAMPTPGEAACLLTWAEALVKDLRAIAE